MGLFKISNCAYVKLQYMQKTINIIKDGKSVRLDVYVQDSDRIFNNVKKYLSID